MGVKELWAILDPVKKHTPLQDLSGQTLAIDLSIWMCDTQQLQGIVQKPYLRNIFFRVLNLIQLRVRPVFVIDGTPPEVKWETIQKRLGVSGGPPKGGAYSRGSYKGVRGHTAAPQKMFRSHFKRLANECCEMLDALGMPYVQSVGEAEAMCAQLNANGLVDACITNDGDAFLYGARTVYKNFTLNSKDPHVESYSMDDIERDLGLNQERLVSLAILLGCDYLPKGVPGIGKELAIKLMNEFKGKHILERFRNWSSDSTLELHKQSGKKPAHCGLCTHAGSRREHQRYGCICCQSTKYCEPNTNLPCTCSWHHMQRGADGRASEIIVWRKAKDVAGFPNQQVIDEFLICKDQVSKILFVWRRPKPFVFHKFALEKMEWEGMYPMEKIIPMMTLIDMCSICDGTATSDTLQPHSIVKSRVKHSVPSFEIKWFKLDHDDIIEDPYYVTVEDQNLVMACFPKMVKDFLEAHGTKKHKTRGKKTTIETNNTIDETDKVNAYPVPDLDHKSLSLGCSSHDTEITVMNNNISDQCKVARKTHHMSTSDNIRPFINIPLVQQHCHITAHLSNLQENVNTCEDEELLPLSQRLALKSQQTTKELVEPTVGDCSENFLIDKKNDILVETSTKHKVQHTDVQVTCENKNELIIEISDDEDSDHVLSTRYKSLDHPVIIPPMVLSPQLDVLSQGSHTRKSDYNSKKRLVKAKYKEMHEIFDMCSILEQSGINYSLPTEPNCTVKSASQPFTLSSQAGKQDELCIVGNCLQDYGSSIKPRQMDVSLQPLCVPEVITSNSSLRVIDVSTPAFVCSKLRHQSWTRNGISPILINNSINDTPESRRRTQCSKYESPFSLGKKSVEINVPLYSDDGHATHTKHHSLAANFHIETSVLSDWSQCSGLDSLVNSSRRLVKPFHEISQNLRKMEDTVNKNAFETSEFLLMQHHEELNIASSRNLEMNQGEQSMYSMVCEEILPKTSNGQQEESNQDKASSRQPHLEDEIQIQALPDLVESKENIPQIQQSVSHGGQKLIADRKKLCNNSDTDSPVPLSLADRLKNRFSSSSGQTVITSISSSRRTTEKLSKNESISNVVQDLDDSDIVLMV